MTKIREFTTSSVGRKQIVATSGLLLILFLIGHLAGNLLIYFGPNAFNGYAKALESFRPVTTLIEIVLLWIFVVHMYFTALLVHENSKARSVSYSQFNSKADRSLATRLMPISGIIIIAFVIWHIKDFTLADKNGLRSILDDGKSYGLYGVVYNSFTDPVHSLFYIIAMLSVGLHLSHGLQSFVQTFGLAAPEHLPLLRKISSVFAVIISFSFSSIPIFIYLKSIGH